MDLIRALIRANCARTVVTEAYNERVVRQTMLIQRIQQPQKLRIRVAGRCVIVTAHDLLLGAIYRPADAKIP